MTALSKITRPESFTFTTFLVFKLLSCKEVVSNKNDNKKCQKVGYV